MKCGVYWEEIFNFKCLVYYSEDWDEFLMLTYGEKKTTHVKMITVLEHLPYGARPGELGGAHREKRSSRETWEPFQCLKGLKESWRGTWEKGLEWQDKGLKLKEGKVRLGVKKKFFAVRMARPWHCWPREAASALPFPDSKIQAFQMEKELLAFFHN